MNRGDVDGERRTVISAAVVAVSGISTAAPMINLRRPIRPAGERFAAGDVPMSLDCEAGPLFGRS